MPNSSWQYTSPSWSIATFCDDRPNTSSSWPTTNLWRDFCRRRSSPALRKACGFVLQFNFTKADVPGRMNSATDFLSRLEPKPKQKVQLLIRTFKHHMSRSTSSHPMLPKRNISTSSQMMQPRRKNTFGKEKASKEKSPEKRHPHNARRTKQQQTNAENETILLQTEIIRRTEGDERDNVTLTSDMRHQQDQDNVLRNYKLRLLKEPYDEQMMTTNQRAH